MIEWLEAPAFAKHKDVGVAFRDQQRRLGRRLVTIALIACVVPWMKSLPRPSSVRLSILNSAAAMSKAASTPLTG